MPTEPWTPEPRRGGLRKVADLPRNPQYDNNCRHPEHNPPSMVVLDDGVYDYECPGCGRVVRFTIQRPHW